MRLIPLLLLSLTLHGCASEPLPPGFSDGGGPRADAAARSCRDLPGDVAAWLAAHAACVSDGDCAISPTRCGLPDYCGAYLNKAGMNGLLDFIASWDAQQCGATIDCASCPRSLPASRCVSGACKAGP